MGVFNGYHIALELTSYVPLKKKQELRKLITTNDGVISFIVTKRCKLLVTLNDEEKAKDSFKCQTALKFNIPVVESKYVFDCIKTGHLVDPDPYVLLGNTKNQLLASGVIAAPQSKASAAKNKKKSGFINLSSVKVWNPSDNSGPSFPEDSYEIAKSIQLVKSDKKLFFVVELHVASSADQFKYRVFTHSGTFTTQHSNKKLDFDIGKKECRYSNSADECLLIYSRICDLQMEAPNSFVKTREYLGRNIGSKKFQQMQLESSVNTEGLDKEVRELVEHIWREALGELQDVLSVPIQSIKNEQVEKAESVLLELKRLLDGDAKNDEIQKLSDEFYVHLTHNVQHQTLINSKHLISKKQELCQLIRDVISVSEGTNWSQRCPLESKYRALRCRIKNLKADTPAYDHIKQHVLTSQKGKSAVEVLSIFEVGRAVEESVFNEKMDNKRLLFHSSHVHNFVGILSRGLLLPKVIVDDCGGTRTDVGLLGSGIYFADDASTSAKYSKPSNCKGSRLMLVNEVALGKCLDLFEFRTELNSAPEGYDSVHGVKSTDDVKSDFKDDEYAIYNTNQQRLQYLVEFKVSDDVIKVLSVEDGDKVAAEEGNTCLSVTEKKDDSVELSDIQNIPDPLLKVKAGLVSDSSAEIPLTAVHVKAKLIDLAAQVIVFQHYKNRSNSPIEAKYVFPLDEMAAVCGFEAFINDKHIIGEVKEKEVAHREYKEAISQGHGAYLMDQDEETPDVFTVSVGNLPPWCDVMIKITYVAELQMEGENISFRIPACVAPWKKSAGLETVTQSELETVKITKEQIETSVQVAVEMPFEIRKIDCTTHRIRLKKTDTKAVVEMQKNQPINEGFQLLISLAEIHVPRMWVERLPDDPDSRACMLTFYPEFEADVADNFEVIFLLDLSNSMKGNSLLEAKKILLLSLLHLPESCFFNVIVFGTDYDELFPCSRAKTPANVHSAEKFIKNQDAVMGNTEVIRPLSSLYLLCPEDGFRNLFLVSDGHISNEKVSLEAVRHNSQRSRLFTFGVGSVTNHHVLRSLATAGCGYYEYFNSKMKSRWERKVRDQLSKAAQPSLSSIQVNWHNYNDTGSSPVQAPAEIMALFNGCRQVVYGFVPDCIQASLKAVVDNQEVSTMVSTADLNITTGKILHQLTARAVIQDWNDGQLASERIEHEILKKNRKNYIIKLSKEFSIITQFTSFVAVEKREKGEVISASKNLNELVQKESVDILEYVGWEDIKCRVYIKSFDQPSFSLDVDLNETFEQLKSKVSEFISKPISLYRSLCATSVASDESLWNQKIENGVTIYAVDEDMSYLCGPHMLRYIDSSERGDYEQLITLVKRKLNHPELDVKWRNEDPVVALETAFEDILSKCRIKKSEGYLVRKKRSLSSRVCQNRCSYSIAYAMNHSSLRSIKTSKDSRDKFGIKDQISHSSFIQPRSESIEFDLEEENILRATRQMHRAEILPCSRDEPDLDLKLDRDDTYSGAVELHRMEPVVRSNAADSVDMYGEIADEDMGFGLCLDSSDSVAQPSTHASSIEVIQRESGTLSFGKQQSVTSMSDAMEPPAFAWTSSSLARPQSFGGTSAFLSDESHSFDTTEAIWKPYSFLKRSLPVADKRTGPTVSPPETKTADVAKNLEEVETFSESHLKRATAASTSESHYSPVSMAAVDASSPSYSPLSRSFVPTVRTSKAASYNPLSYEEPLASLQMLKERQVAWSKVSDEVTPAGSSRRRSKLTSLSDAPVLQGQGFQSSVPPIPHRAPSGEVQHARAGGLFGSAAAYSAKALPPPPGASRHMVKCLESPPQPPPPSSDAPRGFASSSLDTVSAKAVPPPPASLSTFPDSAPQPPPVSSDEPLPAPLGFAFSSRGAYSAKAVPLPTSLNVIPCSELLPPQPPPISSDVPLPVKGGGFTFGSAGGFLSAKAAPPPPAPLKVFPDSAQHLPPLSFDAPPPALSGFTFEAIEFTTKAAGSRPPASLTGFAALGAPPPPPTAPDAPPPLGLTPGLTGLFGARATPLPPVDPSVSQVTAKRLPSFFEEPQQSHSFSAAVCSEFSTPSLNVFSGSAAPPPSVLSGAPPPPPPWTQLGFAFGSPGFSATSGTATSPDKCLESALPKPVDSAQSLVCSVLELSSTDSATSSLIPASKLLAQEADADEEEMVPEYTQPPKESGVVDESVVQSEMSLPAALPLARRSKACDRLARRSKEHHRCVLPKGAAMVVSPPLKPPMDFFAMESHVEVEAEDLLPKEVLADIGFEDSEKGFLEKRKKRKMRVFKAKVYPEIPLTIGIETLGRMMTPVFERNAKIPATRAMLLTTCVNHQTSVRIKVYRGEHELTSYNTLLGELELTGLESMQRGKVKIEARFEIDAHGSLMVRIISQATRCSNEITIQVIEDDLNEEEIEALVRSAKETKSAEPLDLSAMRASAGNWDVCLYEERPFDFLNGGLQSMMNISIGKVSWMLEDWSKLLNLHHEYSETDSVYWDLDDDLGNLLCVDIKKFNQILVENGLNSLGSHAASDVKRLLANLLVLFRIYESSASDQILLDNAQFKDYLKVAESGEEYEEVPEDFNFLLSKASRFVLNMNDKHPLIYSRLNLGRSWPEAATNLLGDGMSGIYLA